MKKLLQSPTKLACLATVVYSLAFLGLPAKAAKVNEAPAKNTKGTHENIAKRITDITGVQLQKTEQGFTLFIETGTGGKPRTPSKIFGDTLVIDLTNTQLRLPSGESFQEKNPIAGIASVEVMQKYANTVRVKLVGENETPATEIYPTEQGFAVGVPSEETEH